MQINNSLNILKPILKWVGGKTQILDKIITKFPTNFNNYHEIFLGGGSVLLGLLTLKKNNFITINGSIYAYDYNDALIHVYKNIQTNHEELFNKIQEHLQNYIESPNINNDNLNRDPNNLSEAKLCKENYYYWIRKQYNNMSDNDKKTVNGSSLFILLNKTCFRGMYRIGPNGFNVSFGNYNSPEVINKDHLNEIHDLIQNVIFQHMDFSQSMNLIQSNDFVYLDPPYAPINSTSFVKYTDIGFDIDKHLQLFNMCHNFKTNNIKFMMSNADVELIRNNFNESINEQTNIYKIVVINCRRKINSKKPNATAKEVIITNY